MKNKKKRMGLGFLVFAFIFLFNPNLNIIDVLPDFIGYAFLCIGLSKLSDMNENIAVAQKQFSRVLIADILKLASLLVVFGMSNPEERDTMLLLVSFVFAVAELVLLIPAYKSLFGGLVGLGFKFENTSVLGTRGNAKKNRTESIRFFTYVFLIIKSVAYTLPEFAVLSNRNYYDLAHAFYLYDFIGLLRAFAFIIALIVGIVWLFRIEFYFRRIRNDVPFMTALVDDYNTNVLPKTALFIRKAVKRMFVFFSVSALLCIDLRIESFNILIDTFAAIALVICFISVRKRLKMRAINTLVPFICYACWSLAAVVTEYGFFNEHYYGKIFRNDEAYFDYKIMIVFAIMDTCAFLFAAFGMGQMFLKVIKDHTGFFVPTPTVNVEEKVKKVHEELTTKVYVFYGAALFVALSDIFYDLYAHTINFAGFINTIASLVFVCAVFSTCYAIGDEVESKYILE